MREFDLLYELQHKSTNIVNFIGLYDDNDIGRGKCMYVMECLEGGSLYTYLTDQKKEGKIVDISKKIQFLMDIAKGMYCLFQYSVLHGDLTSKNILLSKNLTAKISNFGLAKKLDSTEYNVQYIRKEATYQPQWAAPEMFTRQVYTKFTDIWSYGVVCIEVLQDGTIPRLPLPLNQRNQNDDTNLQKFYTAILNGARFPRPPQCPEKMYTEVILQCWKREYKDRIIYSDIIQALSSYLEKDSAQPT